jgi:hypothetical protein
MQQTKMIAEIMDSGDAGNQKLLPSQFPAGGFLPLRQYERRILLDQ